jgi:hypothetical protein
MLVRLLVLAALVLVCAPQAVAVDRYVNCTTGNDAGKSFDDGDLITCQLRVLPSAIPGVYELAFDKAVLAGPDAEALDATFADAQVEVLPTCAADTEAQ